MKNHVEMLIYLNLLYELNELMMMSLEFAIHRPEIKYTEIQDVKHFMKKTIHLVC